MNEEIDTGNAITLLNNGVCSEKYVIIQFCHYENIIGYI